MREIRLSGSEGGVADNGHLYPYREGQRPGWAAHGDSGQKARCSGRDGVSPSVPWAAGRGGDGPRDSGPTGGGSGLRGRWWRFGPAGPLVW